MTDDKMALETRGLLPCPFCGGPAMAIRYRNRLSIKCADLLCGGMTRVALPDEDGAAMWNTRAALTPAPLPGDVERLCDRLGERDPFVNDPISLHPRLRNPDGPAAAAALASYASRLAVVDAERDALKDAKWNVKHVDSMNDMVSMGMARDAAEARAEAAERALEPFAAVVDVLDEVGRIDPEDTRVNVVQAYGCLLSELDEDHFREARAVLDRREASHD